MTFWDSVYIRVMSGLILGAIAVFIFPYILGAPAEFSFGGATWKFLPRGEEPPIYDCSQCPPESVQTVLQPQEFIKIESLKSRKKIFQPEETAAIDFKINNPKKLDFHLTVDWISNEKRIKGWNILDENRFTEYTYYSTYAGLRIAGEWKAQVIVDWNVSDKNYSADDFVTFLVQ